MTYETNLDFDVLFDQNSLAENVNTVREVFLNVNCYAYSELEHCSSLELAQSIFPRNFPSSY